MTAKISKPEYMKDLGPVDTEELVRLVKRVPVDTWEDEDKRKENKFECFHDTQHIVFRFIKGMRDHRSYYSNPLWDFWSAKLLAIMEPIAAEYGYRNPAFPKVMLAKLSAGGEIDKHWDGAGSNLYTHKIHIPLETNELTRMFIRDRWFHLETGRAYEVNNIVAHAVENGGTNDRIHFIFEMFEAKETKPG